MGPTKIMIIRHAEKPGTYAGAAYQGVNALGTNDPESLVTLGWERAGAIANLFDPTNGQFQSAELAMPDFIYAADPDDKKHPHKEPSQRPLQTISALSAKAALPANTSFKDKHYADMVSSVLQLSVTKAGCTVLIAWQHEDILPKKPGDDCIVVELLKQTQTGALAGLPTGSWPGARYDMVFVFDRPTGAGPFTKFTQVPQMLLAGDSSMPIT